MNLDLLTPAPWTLVPSKVDDPFLEMFAPELKPGARLIVGPPQIGNGTPQCPEVFGSTVFAGYGGEDDLQFAVLARAAFDGDPEALAWWEANRKRRDVERTVSHA